MNSDINTLRKAANRLFSNNDILTHNLYQKTLDETTLKKIFRKKAIRFHPDRHRSLGVHPEVLEEGFKQINEAYTDLMAAVSNRRFRVIPSAYRFQGKAHTFKNPKKSRLGKRGYKKPASVLKGFYYTGSIPFRKFRFAEYLFYSGKVKWSHLIDSIVWQRKIRPLIGDIAEDFGYLDKTRINYIQSVRKKGETFGKTALHLGFLSQKQLNVILGKQLSYKQPIGQYFLEKDILNIKEIEQLLRAHCFHNYKVGAGKKYKQNV